LQKNNNVDHNNNNNSNSSGVSGENDNGNNNNQGEMFEEHVPEPTKKKEADIVSDLEALDHSYFIVETMRLLTVADTTQRSLARSIKQHGGRGMDATERRNQVQLEDISCKLRQYASLFSSDEQFDPYHCLSDLYDIQEKIQNIWKSPYGNAKESHQSNTENSANVRYSADDFDNLSSDDEYDDEDDDDTHYSKHKRSGSNSQQQQQRAQQRQTASLTTPNIWLQNTARK